MMSTQAADWPQLLQQPAAGDHFVQVYRDQRFLSDAVAQYAGAGLERGEAVVIIARPEHREAFARELAAKNLDIATLMQHGRLVLLDAEETLATFMQDGRPDWQRFHAQIGGLIAKMRLEFPGVCAYGEMVDLLWQRGERDAALRLEEFWNDLARLQTFSLLCAYFMDNLDAAAYPGPLECVCKVHTHLIPARDYARFNEAVVQASKQVLDEPLAQMLLSLSARHRPHAVMPEGQATLLWLTRNMPRTAEKVLAEVRARCS